MALSPGDLERMLSLAPEDLWRQLCRLLEAHRGKPGRRRVIVAELHLSDRDGKVVADLSSIQPPRIGIIAD